jgi:hypothetical protein
MSIDPLAFRFAGSIVFGDIQQVKRLPSSLDAPLLRVTSVLGRAKPGKTDNRKNWNKGGVIRQVDRTGAEIRLKYLSLQRPLLFWTDPGLAPYWVEFWRPVWVKPLTLKIERYTKPIDTSCSQIADALGIDPTDNYPPAWPWLQADGQDYALGGDYADDP